LKNVLRIFQKAKGPKIYPKGSPYQLLSTVWMSDLKKKCEAGAALYQAAIFRKTTM